MSTRPFEVDKQEYPFESHWYTHEGRAMHYIDEGSGVPVVFCHGNPTWSYLYRNIIKDLRTECRCIAYDLPGFGFSEHPETYGYTPQEHAEKIEALLINHLKLDQFIMVVQDWGGPTGLDVATRYPDKIIGLVISSTWAWEASTIGSMFSRLMASKIAQHLIIKRNFFARRLVPMLLAKKANTATLNAYTAPFPTPASRKGTAVFPVQIRAASPWLKSLETRLSSLSGKPVQFIFGLKDLLSKPADIEKWCAHFPNNEVQKDATAGHYTQEDCPERFVEAVRRLLSEH